MKIFNHLMLSVVKTLTIYFQGDLKLKTTAQVKFRDIDLNILHY